MRLQTLLTTLAALAPVALSAPAKRWAPTFFVKNHCPFSIWVTSVGTQPGKPTEVKSSATWAEAAYFGGIGTAIKVTRTADGLWTSKPVLIAGYTYKKGESIYYDLSTAFGFDFDGYTIKLDGKGGNDLWQGHPDPQHTIGYLGETDLTLDLCL